MMACECPMAGWCERHKLEKTPHWHSLCQTRESYFDAWEEGRGPGQQREKRVDPEKYQRVKARAERKERLISWLIFFRHPGDTGLGDTLARLIAVAGEREVRAELVAMQKACACRAGDAVRVLNRRYRY